MSPEKPNLGKPMQQLSVLIIMQQWILSTISMHNLANPLQEKLATKISETFCLTRH